MKQRRHPPQRTWVVQKVIHVHVAGARVLLPRLVFKLLGGDDRFTSVGWWWSGACVPAAGRATLSAMPATGRRPRLPLRCAVGARSALQGAGRGPTCVARAGCAHLAVVAHCRLHHFAIGDLVEGRAQLLGVLRGAKESGQVGQGPRAGRPWTCGGRAEWKLTSAMAAIVQSRMQLFTA